MPAHEPNDEQTIDNSHTPESGADDQTRVRAADTVVAQPDGAPLIAGYELAGEIARGGMGVVYRARDVAFDREVAVKVMLPGMTAADFVRESRITARLPHPGIPPVYALGTLADGRPFLAMKLIRGDTLDTLLRARTDPAAERGRFLAAFEQMCQAVGYAHAQGIVHRDLKPANVMVGAFGEVQVMDWGLAKAVGAAETDATVPGAGGAFSEDVAATVAGQIKGTPAYMAPEQARGESVDARADVFALGGILAAILTGKPPFAGNSVLDTIIRAAKAELDGVYGRLDACDPDEELIGLAKRCLAARAEDRPADGTEVTAAVAAYRAGVDARLRQAEQDAAAAEARAAEERNTRREAEARADAERARGDEQRKRRRVQLAFAGVVAASLAGAGIAAALVIEQRAADELAAEKRQADERVAAEKKLADARAAAEDKRQADLKAADDAARARQRQTRADSLVQALESADTAGVPRIVADLSDLRELARPKLGELAAKPAFDKAGLHARLALLAEEPQRATELAAYLPTCRPDELLTVRDALTPHAAAVAPGLWAVLTNQKTNPGRRVRAACALAGMTPTDERWAKVTSDVTAALMKASAGEFVVWAAALEPVRGVLVLPLVTRYLHARWVIEGGKLSASELAAAVSGCDRTADLLARYADQPAHLAELALLADPRHYPQFAGALNTNKAAVVPLLKAELAKAPPEKLAVDTLDKELEAWGKRRGYAAAALVALGEAEGVWPVFAFPTDGDPTARSYLQERLAAVGADPLALMRRLESEADASAKRALVVALGDFPLAVVPAAEWAAFTAKLLALYRGDPDAGLHSAIDWLLRQKWGRAAELAAVDAELAREARAKAAARAVAGAAVPAGVPSGVVGPQLPAPRVAVGKDWFVNGEGQTFAVVRGPVEFAMGSPLSEPNRSAGGDEHRHPKRVPRAFAIATREVTVEQFLRFQPEHKWDPRYSPGPDTPAVSMTWYQAAEYCNKLSEWEGIPPDQWCYERNAAGKYGPGMRIKAGHLALTGYRLPTEAEWEFASRAGATTARYHGRGEELRPRYAWFARTGDERAGPVGTLRPNDLGLFDVLCNVSEWCGNAGYPYATAPHDDDGNARPQLVDRQTDLMFRGGGFIGQPALSRSAARAHGHPGESDYAIGFRPARTLP